MNTMHNNNSLFSSSSNGTNAIFLFPASIDILCEFVPETAEFLDVNTKSNATEMLPHYKKREDEQWSRLSN